MSSSAQIMRSGEIVEFTRFEKARIISARALQISEGAPVLVDIPADLIDPVTIAELEFKAGVLPITSHREVRAMRKSGEAKK